VLLSETLNDVLEGERRAISHKTSQLLHFLPWEELENQLLFSILFISL